MLPLQNRLPLREQKDFFSRATKKRFSAFLLYTLTSSTPHARFAISIKSERTSAVERNRLKRVIRATLLPHITHIRPADYCIAVHSHQENIVLKELQQCLKLLAKTT